MIIIIFKTENIFKKEIMNLKFELKNINYYILSLKTIMNLKSNATQLFLTVKINLFQFEVEFQLRKFWVFKSYFLKKVINIIIFVNSLLDNNLNNK